ncbi:histamine N-methyltransferase-like [Actinia tenebrosa]|uniref:Histamine N-methyltransferase-like n=1 Tax=Actinia tenebrosa TaxID=6105 RepID=A0A6P8J2U1_ACTTE|nr:histamine N-methyltransferase-like [Actinia tenebrosa]
MNLNVDIHNDAYAQCYKSYLERSSQRDADKCCLQQKIPAELHKLQLGKDKPRFSILSIGAGDGFFDQEMLKIVLEKYLNAGDKQLQEVEILNAAVEPNPALLGQYKESIERSSDGSKGLSNQRSVKFDLKLMSFEGYAESKHDQNQYDLVHAIHSLYYVDIESTLKHCYHNELGEKGLIVCLLGDNSNLTALTSLILDKHRPECQRKPWSNPPANVISIAEKNSMKYEKVVVPFKVDITSVFDESSEEGRQMLDFFTHENNYRQTADQKELNEVLKMYREISTEDDNGKLIANGTHVLILISKNLQNHVIVNDV